MPDEEIVRRHDALTAYFNHDMSMRAAYVNELDRRAAARSARASVRWVIATTALSVVATVAAIIALFKP